MIQIIHEITHAIIRSNLTYDQNKAMLDTEKHYIMLQNYVQGMKAYLQETFTLNDQEALSMIFGGIGDLNNENNSTGVYADWGNNFKKIVSSHGFSLIYGDANYYLNEIDFFKSGVKGSKNCN